MRIQYPVYNASPYYDRIPLQKFINYEGLGIAPHGETQRDLYSVPTGRRARVTSISLLAVRITVAAPVGLVKATLRVTSGAVTRDVQYAVMLDNNVGGRCEVHIGESLWLESNDELRLMTTDLSTGGTVTYYLTAMICEYKKSL